MRIEADSPEQYISQLPEERKDAMERLRALIKENIPAGFQEIMSYGMISYVVPHSIYPPGYHVDPKQPLPFISLASQKNHIAFYHMGIYGFPELLDWFQTEYAKQVSTKLDMGKGCIRFKRTANIPYELLKELCKRIAVEDYIKNYEARKS